MDNNDNDNHPSRITRTAARLWSNQFGFCDWRGGVQHEWHANGVGMLGPEQISTFLCSNPIQWSDYSLVKKQIAYTQIEITIWSSQLNLLKK